MLLNLLSYNVYPVPLPLGKDILPILVCKHIFLSIGLINLIISFSFPLGCLTFLWSIWYKQKLFPAYKIPWCTTLSVRPCYYCWWHSGNHRWTRTLPIGPPHSTSRNMVLFVPRPWYQRCWQHNWQSIIWHALLSPPFLLLTHMVGS